MCGGVPTSFQVMTTPSKRLYDAVNNGNHEVVKLLLEDPRVDPSDRDNTAIGLTASFGRLDVVKLLLDDPRVDPSDHHNFAILYV